MDPMDKADAQTPEMGKGTVNGKGARRFDSKVRPDLVHFNFAEWYLLNAGQSHLGYNGF
jgi:hypothetical protein